MRFLNRVFRVLDRIVDGGGLVGGMFILLLVAIILWEVIVRYLLGQGTTWAVEISEYILLYFPFLVAAFVLKQEGHVRLDVILGRLKPKTQYLVNLISSIVIVIVCMFIMWFGVKVTLRLFENGDTTATALMVPKFILVAVIPFGAFLLVIQSIRRAYNYWCRFQESATGG